jgi:WD40 repeat protein
MKLYRMVFVTLLLLISACGDSTPEPSTEPTPEPTNTSLPTSTPTPEPTPTETLIPSPTPYPLPDPITIENISNIVLVESFEGRYRDYLSSNYLLVIQGDSSITVWNTAAQQVSYQFDGSYIQSSQDETLILIKNSDVIELRNASTGELIMSIDDFNFARFHPLEDKILVSNSETGIGQLWEIGGSAPIVEFQLNQSFEGHVWGYSFSADGEFILGIEAYKIMIWDSNTGDFLHEFTHDNDGGTINSSPTQNVIAYFTGGLGWYIIDLGSGEILHKFNRDAWVRYSGDGEYLILGSWKNRVVRFVDPETFEIAKAVPGTIFGFLDTELGLFSVADTDPYNYHYWVYDYTSFEQVLYFYSDTDLSAFKSEGTGILGLIDCKYHCWRPWRGSLTTFYDISTGGAIFEMPEDTAFYYSGVFTPDNHWLFLFFRDEDQNYTLDVWQIPE